MMTLVRTRIVPSASRAGLSYLDMVVTVLIVGVLAGMTTPRFATSLQGHRAQAAAFRLRADLAQARQQAISRSTSLTVQFSPRMMSYSIDGSQHLDRPGEKHVVFLADEPYHATQLSLSWGTPPTVQFDLHGRPNHGGTITVHSGSARRTILIDPETGEASVP